MTKQTRKFISNLRQQFRESSFQTKQEIWDILTGLRGPDYGDDKHKQSTTAVIRYKLFGKSLTENVPAMVNTDSTENLAIRQSASISGHFRYHAKYAFFVLGLKWDEVNK